MKKAALSYPQGGFFMANLQRAAAAINRYSRNPVTSRRTRWVGTFGFSVMALATDDQSKEGGNGQDGGSGGGGGPARC